MQHPPWLRHAWREFGAREIAGSADNPRILALYRDAGHAEVAHDEVAWCAAFVGASLERGGIRSTRSLLARSYADWGCNISEARFGAIAVLSRGSDPALGHVGFVIGETDDDVLLLGGNQGDAVSVVPFAKSRLVALRWPQDTPDAVPANSGDAGFARALAHVLDMEGGWDDDPYDPGGPTNFGITIRDYASWRGVGLDGGSYGALKADLKRIAPETVREIYRRRYWDAAQCAALPPALAFMHFDAAVNHGTGTAIRSLQEAAGAEADGEIGPLTHAAIASASIPETLRRYAEIRRRRYRALAHFWRFGKGWLARVDRTLAAALALAGAPALPATLPTKGTEDMFNQADNAVPAKWWGQSMTIWGAVITSLATVVPALGPLIGVDITGDLVRDAGAHMVSAVQALAGLFGTLMTIYGRIRASQPLARRAVSLRV